MSIGQLPRNEINDTVDFSRYEYLSELTVDIANNLYHRYKFNSLHILLSFTLSTLAIHPISSTHSSTRVHTGTRNYFGGVPTFESKN
jgi:hypothetical protein